MEVLIRGINNKNNVEKLRDIADLHEMNADLLGQEFKTTQNTLSCWFADTDEEESIRNAIKALIFANPDKAEKIKNKMELERQDYIVLDFKELTSKFDCIESDPGLKDDSVDLFTDDLKSLHRDIKILQLSNILELAEIYKEVVDSDDKAAQLLVRMSKKEIKDHINEWTARRSV